MHTLAGVLYNQLHDSCQRATDVQGRASEAVNMRQAQHVASWHSRAPSRDRLTWWLGRGHAHAAQLHDVHPQSL